MKINPKIILFVLLFIIIITGCSDADNIISEYIAKNPKALLPAIEFIDANQDISVVDKRWYKEISLTMIDDVETEKDVVQEYVVCRYISFAGEEHIHIKVFVDGTGKITSKFLSGDEDDVREMIINNSLLISEVQSKEIAKVFERNHFWKSPSLVTSLKPDEMMLDGSIIFVEGINKDKYNFVIGEELDDKYEIKKIYNEIISLAKSWGLQVRG